VTKSLVRARATARSLYVGFRVRSALGASGGEPVVLGRRRLFLGSGMSYENSSACRDPGSHAFSYARARYYAPACDFTLPYDPPFGPAPSRKAGEGWIAFKSDLAQPLGRQKDRDRPFALPRANGGLACDSARMGGALSLRTYDGQHSGATKGGDQASRTTSPSSLMKLAG